MQIQHFAPALELLQRESHLDQIVKLVGPDALPDDQKVMLKLTLPEKPNHYKSLVEHPRVMRVVALSGGYSREEACRELAKNDGMIASFSRATLQDLRVDQSDAEFDAALVEEVQNNPKVIEAYLGRGAANVA